MTRAAALAPRGTRALTRRPSPLQRPAPPAVGPVRPLASPPRRARRRLTFWAKYDLVLVVTFAALWIVHGLMKWGGLR